MVTLATAYVDIRAKFDKFDRELREGVDKAFSRSGKSFEKSNLKGSFQEFEKALDKVSSKISGMSLLVLNLAKPLAALGGAAIQAGGALLTLPGALTALIGVFAAVKISLIGVSKAFEFLLKGDVGKFDEEVKGLSKNAKSFLLLIKQMIPQFTAVRNSIQNAFFKSFSNDLLLLNTITLPTFQTGLIKVATSLNAVIQQVVYFLMQQSSLKQFGVVFNDIKTILDTLAPAVQPFLKAILDLIVVGLNALTVRTGTAATAITNFSTKISTAAKNGSLKKFIDDGITRLGQLKDIASSTVGIITGVFTAVSGKPTKGGDDPVKDLKDFTEQVNKFVNSPAGQQKIKDLFDQLARAGAIALGVRSLGLAVGALSGALALAEGPVGVAILSFAALGASLKLAYDHSKNLQGAVKAFTDFLGSKGFKDSLDKAGKALDTLFFAFDQRAKEIDGLVTLIRNAFVGLGNYIVSFVDGTKKQFDALVKDAQDLWKNLVAALTGDLSAFVEAGKKIGKAILDGLGKFSFFGAAVNLIKSKLTSPSPSSPRPQAAPSPRGLSLVPGLTGRTQATISALSAGTVINQVIQLPTGNPEAAALTVANRIAAAVA